MGYNHLRIKQNAKTFYSINKGNAIIVSLILAILVGSPSIIQEKVNISSNQASMNGNYEYAIGILGIAMLVSLIAVAYSIFFSGLVNMGGITWFNTAINDKNADVGHIFKPFKNYWSNFCVVFYKNLMIFLFTLLLVVPGIIKAYEYMMVEYLKMENPNLTAAQATELSSRITKGHKGDLFYLTLSFLGWFLLGALTFGILNIVYVNPYYYAAQAFAYQELKAEALAKGIARPEEFGMTPQY